MGSGSRRRLDAAVAVVVSTAVVVSLVVAALGHDGFRDRQIRLHDGGVWVTSSADGLVGRINTQTYSIEVSAAAGGDGGATGATVDVIQEAGQVALIDGSRNELSVIEVSRARPGSPIRLPAGATVQLGGGQVLVSDARDGSVWVTPFAEIADLDVTTDRPDATLGEGAVAAIGPSGAAFGYQPGDESVTRIGEGSSAAIPLPEAVEQPSITVVGERPVLLDEARNKIVIADGPAIDVEGADPVLQQPGPAEPAVVWASDSGLWRASLTSGTPTLVHGVEASRAVAPIRRAGCTYGAWQGGLRWAQACDRAPVRADVLRDWSDPELRFRSNRDRVVLNDYRSGLSLVFSETDPVVVDDWESALQREETPSPEVSPGTPPECDPSVRSAPAPEDDGLKDDDAIVTRVDRPVIVPVLANDGADGCDVLVVLPVDDVPNATVDVVEAGAAVQVTPDPGFEGEITFEYQVQTPDEAVDSAAVRVQVRPPGQSGEPLPAPDETLVESGRSVDHNVLDNDRHSEGDSLTLVGATVENAGDGVVQFQADGQVRFTAAGDKVGTALVTYLVSDESGSEPVAGTLTVQVQTPGVNIPPTVRSDRLTAFVDTSATVDLLANDTDPNGDVLRVAAVEADPELGADVDDDGVLTVTPTAPGIYPFSYTVSDDVADVVGYGRVDVRQSDGNAPPLAVRDDVVVRPGTPALVDLLANDIDLDGDVLAVVDVEVDPSALGLSFELLESRVARISASAGFAAATTVGYTVTDGLDFARGVAVVRPYLSDGLDQSPVTARDQIRVRAGNAATLEVLANDIDPEGEVLEIDPEVPEFLPAGGVDVFVQGDLVKIQARESARGTYRSGYTVIDPAGNRADGELVVTVDAPSDSNSAPAPEVIEARVISGVDTPIPVPLIGIDPEGDAVRLDGIEAPPTKGSLTLQGSGFVYRSDPGARGADEFTYRLRDSRGAASEGRVRLVVIRPPSNTAPVAVADEVTIAPGDDLVVPVLDNDTDADGDDLTLLQGDGDEPYGATHAARDLEVTEEGIRYTAGPVTEDVVLDSFVYTITDGRGGSARGLVTVTIQTGEAPPSPPIAGDDLLEPQLAGTTATVPVLANDHDPDDPEADLDVEVLNLSGVRRSGGNLLVPLGDRSVTFIYEVTDGDGLTARAFVQIPVVAALSPTAVADEDTVEPGGQVTIDVLANDTPGTEGATLVLDEALMSVRGGEAEVVDGQVAFTAPREPTGIGGFAYRVTEGDGLSAVGFVTVVVGGEFLPEIQSTSVTLAAGSTRRLDLQSLVSDIDQEDGHRFTLEGQVPSVTATVTGGSMLQLVADADGRGQSGVVTVIAADEDGGTARADIRISVDPFDSPPPVAVDDAAETTQGQPVSIPVLANDVAGPGTTLVLTSARVAGSSGSVTTAGSAVRFTPAATFRGVAQITYVIGDSTGEASRTAQAVARVTVIGVPDAPPAPSGRAENGTVLLTWGVPSNNGAPISGYEVEAEGGPTLSARSNSVEFRGLTNGQSYRFRVRALNRATTGGLNGPWSAYSAPLTPDQRPTAPGAPTAEPGDGSVRLSWGAPQFEGSAVTSYVVRRSGPGGGASTQTTTATNLVWSGLTNGVAYTFQVRAINDAGEGDFGSSSAPVTPFGPPLAPTGVSAAAEGDGAGLAIRVTWSFDNGVQGNGSPVTGFAVTGQGLSQNVGASARQVVFEGVTAGRTYTFSVTASNQAGAGAAGTSEPVTPVRTPGPITGASVTEPGESGVALVTFTAPDSGGEALRYETDKGSPSGSGSPLRISGLPNTEVEVSIRACNSRGCGPFTPVVARPYGPPRPPTVDTPQWIDVERWRWTWREGSGEGRQIRDTIVTVGGIRVPVGSPTTGSGAVEVDVPLRTSVEVCVSLVVEDAANPTTPVCRPNRAMFPQAFLRQGAPAGCSPTCYFTNVEHVDMPAGTYSYQCRNAFGQNVSGVVQMSGSGVVETLCGTPSGGLPPNLTLVHQNGQFSITATFG